ncbi:MAG: ferredoxin--NADP reductase [Neisseriaceae bacterium]|nr:ferredoxin--NADP reductase [Neisseriaceae bacterium]
MSAPLETKYTEETVLWITRHTDKLMSFGITRPESYRFAAGQFSRLGFQQAHGFIWRAYSVVSAEYEDTLEFFAVLIEGGPFSEYFKTMAVGDQILLDKNATGFLLPERFTDGSDLVMLSTGSGIAPFMSILKQPSIWTRFERLVLVHSVSHEGDLVFNQQVADLKEHPLVGEFFDKLTFQPVVTREKVDGALNARLPDLIKDDTLSAAIDLPFTQAATRFMICGNPDMVMDTHKALSAKGFNLNRVRVPGHILLENGF